MPTRDPAKKAAQRKRWAEKNPEKLKAARKRWLENNPDRAAKQREYGARWRLRNGISPRELSSLPTAGFLADPTDPRHGTSNGYTNLRCRCDPCRAANTTACRERARRKRESA